MSSKGCLDITDLHRLEVAYRFAPGFLFEQRDDLHQILAAAVADIVELHAARCCRPLSPSPFSARWHVETGDDAADNIVDVSEVAQHLAAVEKRQRIARE